jgi:hypothetical protein
VEPLKHQHLQHNARAEISLVVARIIDVQCGEPQSIPVCTVDRKQQVAAQLCVPVIGSAYGGPACIRVDSGQHGAGLVMGGIGIGSLE